MKALALRDLRKVYASGVVALHGIDLDVEQGDFFGLLGPNGAGKSTTISIISSLVNKTAGSVQVFGHDLDRDPASVKASIGLVPQEFNFSVFEKVRHIVINQGGYYGLDRELATQRCETYLRQLGLWEKRDSQARLLSGGMKRRLMIARALVHEPRLLILDEPTAGVDIELRRSMWDFLREINRRGTTIILTTHYLEEAESLCRNLAIIDQGRIIQNTSVRKLIATLDNETFILDLRDEVHALPELNGCRLRQLDPVTLEVDVARADGLNPVFEQLTRAGIEVLSMRNKANRLEELFLDLVESNKARA
jgi:ABC-2 type transport system ATP-binding protein